MGETFEAGWGSAARDEEHKGLDTPKLYEPAFICHKMFEPIIEYDGQLINVNAVARAQKIGGDTHITFKGIEQTVTYHSFDLFDLIKGTLAR